MTEDRLTHLLTEATDLAPTEALRERVIPSPQPLSPGGARGFRRLSWFALSGASAALAVVAFLAIPREASAAELLRRADEALSLNVTYQLDAESLNDGSWRKIGTLFHEPGRSLAHYADGAFSLRTPDVLNLRFVPEGPVLRTRDVPDLPEGRSVLDDPRPAAQARRIALFKSHGRSAPPLPTTAGEPREEDGRMVRDVDVTIESKYRWHYVIDVDKGLPLRMESQAQEAGLWRARNRLRFTYLKPGQSEPAFAAALRGARVVDADALRRTWERRLARIVRRVPSDDGESLEIRDLRTLPNGDALVLYTGTPNVLASLEGPNGEPFARCGFDPESARFENGAVAPLRPSGKRLYGLWFVPLHRDRPVDGPLRLRLWRGQLDRPSQSYRAIADVRLDAPLQATPFPPYRDALPARPFDAAEDFYRTCARVNALAGRWLDLKGRPLPDPVLQYGLDELSLSAPWLVSPYDAERHDPRAAAEAARILRAYLTRPHALWPRTYLDHKDAAPDLARLDAWAK